MKTFLIVMLFCSAIIAQTKIGSNELFFYQDGSGSTTFTYYFRPIVPVVWNQYGDKMTIDHYGYSVFFPPSLNLIGKYDDIAGPNGMDYILSRSGEQWPLYGNSLYQVNCKINGTLQAYFYLDTRDCDYPNSWYNDFTIKYLNSSKKFYFASGKGVPYNSSKFREVTDKVVYLWEAEPKVGPKVECFDEYWNNCLGLGHFSNTHPFSLLAVRLIWGPHPEFNTTSYKIFRSIPGTSKYKVIATVDNKTFDYEDWDTFYWNTDGIKYYVKAYNGSTYSSRTNIANTPQYKSYKEAANSIDLAIEDYKISQNYPNPFNPTTRISYQIPEQGQVVLKIYNTLGKEVAELVNETKEKGSYSVTFDAENLPSGMYFYKIQSGIFSDVKKMLFLK